MINKKPTRTYATLKNLFIFPVVAIIIAAFSLKALPPIEKITIEKSDVTGTKLSAPEAKGSVKELTDIKIDRSSEKLAVRKEKSIPEKQDDTKDYSKIEQMPQFPGGVKEMMNFIKKNLRYPVIAQEQGKTGTVLVQFIVDKNGKIANAKVINEANSALGEEAIRMVRKMPDWTPGKQGGKVVNVACTIPFKFLLDPKQDTPSLKGDFPEVVAVGYGIPKPGDVQRIVNVDSLLISLQNIDETKLPIVFS